MEVLNLHKNMDRTVKLAKGEEKFFVWIFGEAKDFIGNFRFELYEDAKLNNIFLFSCSGDKSLNIKISVNHKDKNSSSNTAVRAIARGKSGVSVEGNMAVGKEAMHSGIWFDGRALLFDEASCRIDPRLEISTAEVARAGHAAAVSRMSDDDIFYMATRGVDRAKAEQLKSLGFLSAPLFQYGFHAKEAEKIINTHFA